MFANVDITEVEYNKYMEFIMPSIMYLDKYEKSKDRHPPIYLQSDAIKYIQNRTAYKFNPNYTKGILLVDFMPNLETSDEKAKFLGYIIREFANVIFGINQESDKDSYVYKRIDTSGVLLADLFKDAYSNYVNQIKSILNRQYNYGTTLKSNKENNKKFSEFINENNIHKLISASYLTDVFLRSLKMKWGTSESEDVRVVQDLSRLSYIGYLSHLRRLNLPLDRTLKVYNPHRLHPHQFGFVCPYETPDGGSIGLLKNLAYLTRVSAGTPENDVVDALEFTQLVTKLKDVYGGNIMSKKICKVFINGTWYGITINPIKLYKLLRMFKLNCIINILISIAWNIHKNEIRILTEPSRPVRPFIRLLNTEYTFKNYNWFELITGITDTSIDEDIYTRCGFNLSDEFKNLSNDLDKLIQTLEKTAAKIEYLDIEELDVNLIAMTSKDTQKDNHYTHLEIHPSLIMSVVSANIPFANHSFAARNIFHAAQSKQAISVYATNFVERFDTMSFVYHYPQKPLIGTRLAHYTNSDKMPNGFNIIIAVMSYSGYNQEDSLMINKAAIDRGFESLSYYKSVSLTAKVVSINERTIFINPDILREKGFIVKNYRERANYTYLNDEGFVKEGVYIPPSVDTAIIGMVLERTVTKEIRRGLFLDTERVIEYVDNSLITDNNLYGVVDKVYITKTTSDNGNQICKVRMLKIKNPELGDKHSSRHGQKGVIGRILNECDMPFTKQGIRPDIIMNAHAFPSRMTIGHIVECVFAKLCCMRGSYGDGTVFMDFDRDTIMDELQTYDFNRHGNEILYNGIDGKMIETDIFIGPVYYFRLKHMVAEKLNARGTGPMQFLTRQPTEGRRKGGGLRIGEMERDALLGHGIGNFISESMMERSDNAQFPICNRCGILAITGKEKFYCKRCDEQDISMVKMPYTFKLLSQEMETMSLNMNFNINNDIDIEIQDIQIRDIDIDAIIKQNVKPDDIPIVQTVDKPIVKKICKDNKILNPETNRCIDPNGNIAKDLRAKKKIVGGEGDSDNYQKEEGENLIDSDNYQSDEGENNNTLLNDELNNFEETRQNINFDEFDMDIENQLDGQNIDLIRVFDI
jgi:DNA-directed RNA polymerase II subunit RPB2